VALGRVLDVHIGFNASESSSSGIGMELEIVDRSSRRLASRASGILAAASVRGDGLAARARHEFMECIIEVDTGMCATVAMSIGCLRAALL
jgi:carboxylate-amine ligase